MYKNTVLLKTVLLSSSLVLSSSAAAQCFVPPKLVADIINGTTNTQVCVDVPVAMNNEKVVFNLDIPVTTDGSANGTPAGLRHLWMLATANVARIQKFQLDPSQFTIIGVMHGKAATWALSNEWWIDNVPGATGNPYAPWLEKILAMKAANINIQLEICGVTMRGKNWSNIIGSTWVDANGVTHTHTYSDVYPGILVNQGAIGRIIDLQQKGYAYYQEGYVDNDSLYELKDADEDKKKSDEQD